MGPRGRRHRRHRPLLLPAATLLATLLASAAFAGGQATASKGALSTDSPLATRAGLGVLQSGGNAADAAVAVAFALAAAQPQAGNLGGGGFLTYYDAATGGVWTLDFSEVAPLGATREMFGKDPAASRTGPLAAAVPGTVAGLDAMHVKFGSRPWKELLQPAIRIAREGFVVNGQLAHDVDALRAERSVGRFPGTTAFLQRAQRDAKLTQPDLASSLERIAVGGAQELYEGALARILVEGTRAAGGLIGYRDLRDYKPIWRSPVKLRFGAYDVYTVAPPSGGGLVIGETLNILAGDDLAALGFQTPAAIHLLVEAERRAYLDRNRYLSDPAGARLPYRELLSRSRAEAWRKTIDPKHVIASAILAEPAMLTTEGEHTTHFTIVDSAGNIAAVTTSLGESFGSGFIPPGLGFFLNNAMDDFSGGGAAAPNHDGLVQGGANRIDPGKRTTSSMSPTIVLRDGKPFLALGTSGGPAIPTTILQVLLNVTVYGRSLADAVAAPRYHHQGLPEDLFYEQGRAPQSTIDALNAMGHGVAARDAIGAVHAIMWDGTRIIAVADPRTDGAAGGF